MPKPLGYLDPTPEELEVIVGCGNCGKETIITGTTDDGVMLRAKEEANRHSLVCAKNPAVMQARSAGRLALVSLMFTVLAWVLFVGHLFIWGGH